jgi:hypothetical protein
MKKTTKIKFKRKKTMKQLREDWRKKNPKKVYESKVRNYKKGRKPQRKRVWEPEEDQLVRLHLVPDRDLSNIINRGVAAIQVRRSKLRKEDAAYEVLHLQQREATPGWQSILRDRDSGPGEHPTVGGQRSLRTGDVGGPGSEPPVSRYTVRSGELSNGYEWAIDLHGYRILVCFANDFGAEVYEKDFLAWGEYACATALIFAQRCDPQNLFNNKGVLTKMGFTLLESSIEE